MRRQGMTVRRAAAAILAGVLAATARADEVTLVDKTKLTNCKVLAESAKQVEIDTTLNGAPDRVIPSEKVATISYADRSFDYRQAELFFNSGDFARAVKAFGAIADGPVGPAKWANAYASYYRAVALQRWAESDPAKAPEAVKALGDFVTRHANSRFIYQARLSLARAYLVQEKYDEVRRHIEAVISEKPKTRWALTGRLLLGRVKLKQNDPKGADAEFDAVLAGLSDADKGSAVWAEATVGKGLGLLAEGKVEGAEKILYDLIESTTDDKARALAYNALGDARFKKEQFAEALLKYLRVVVLYFRADPVEHAKALYYAAECFRRLGQQARANELFAELARQYPGSPWTAKSPVKPEGGGGGE